MASLVKIIAEVILFLRFLQTSFSVPLDGKIEKPFELSIIHYGDFHGRYLPISPTNGICHEYEKEKCAGGIARISAIARKLKDTRLNAIFLNAGDNFQGTLYYDVHRSNMTVQFMNKLHHDIMTLGNHDFDEGLSGLKSFLERLNVPVVVTNIDASEEPTIQNLISNSTVIKKDGRDIGVIGVIFNKTGRVPLTGKLKFLDEVETINLEVAKLKSKGIGIIIVLSHCGVQVEKVIAENCPDVDVIVGSHSHTLLYNGIPPVKDTVYDKYPIVIKQNRTNRNVLIVHSGAYTKYIGDLQLVFDNKGELISWKGNPIYLDANIEEDPEIVQELEPWKAEVDRIGKQSIGYTKVFLNASCPGECTLGNLVTDAMVDAFSNEKAKIGLIIANGLGNSIAEGPILYEDEYTFLIINNTWALIELKGSDLLQVLEDSVEGKFENGFFINNGLLLFSGLKVVYNISNQKSKVVDVKVRSSDCKDKFEDLHRETWYKIVVPHYLNTIFKAMYKNFRFVANGKPGYQHLINYIEKVRVVDVRNESRMVFV